MIPILVAFQFLTIFPALIKRMFAAREMGQSVGWFPLVGVALGFALYGVHYAAQLIFPASVSAALTILAWVIFTRAFHLDGFMDTCDGLFGGWTPERRLEIMKDSHVGAFGVIGGILILLIKYTALASSPDPLPALVMSTTLARLGMSITLFVFPYAREKGLGRDMKDNAGWTQVLLATIISLIVSWFAYGWLGIAIMIFAVLAALLVAFYITRLIPGLTGDSYGALAELLETFVLLGFVLRW